MAHFDVTIFPKPCGQSSRRAAPFRKEVRPFGATSGDARWRKSHVHRSEFNKSSNRQTSFTWEYIIWTIHIGNYLNNLSNIFKLENVTHPNKYHWRERNDEANSWLFQIPDVENEWSWNTSISLFFSLCSVLFAAIRESSHDLAFLKREP